MTENRALYPAYLNLAGRAALVVGGGSVAARKVAALRASGARVTVVAPQIDPDLARGAHGAVTVRRRAYRAADLRRAWLVIAATNDPAVNRAVAADAARARLFCNVVDQPELCTFQAPAAVRRGLLQIAISTGGASPALAREIRRDLERQFGPEYATLLANLQRRREEAKRDQPSATARRRLLLAAGREAARGRARRTGQTRRDRR